MDYLCNGVAQLVALYFAECKLGRCINEAQPLSPGAQQIAWRVHVYAMHTQITVINWG